MTAYRLPNGCHLCGVERPVHGQQWADAVGWHEWAAPPPALRLIRQAAQRFRGGGPG